ncbi:MAG: beta-ketoacyl synthase, partial [Ectopseudomonas oleovorans]
DRVAAAFGIEQWPVTAVKAFVGHSLATASGDQVIGALGAFKYGIVPGLKTIDAVAGDVHQDHLSLSTEDRKVGEASALVLAPHVTERMLRKRHGQAAFDAYLARREGTRAAAAAYDQLALQGKLDIIYNFGNDMIDDQAISITTEEVKVPGFDQPLVFRKDARYSDMLD